MFGNLFGRMAYDTAAAIELQRTVAAVREAVAATEAGRDAAARADHAAWMLRRVLGVLALLPGDAQVWEAREAVALVLDPRLVTKNGRSGDRYADDEIARRVADRHNGVGR